MHELQERGTSKHRPQPQKMCNHCLKSGHIEQYCYSKKAEKIKDSAENLYYLKGKASDAKRNGKEATALAVSAAPAVDR
jgi:hypothetical protein